MREKKITCLTNSNIFKGWSRQLGGGEEVVNSYLSHLQNRHRWQFSENNVLTDILVLLKDDQLPMYKWSIGRITRLFQVQMVQEELYLLILKRAFSRDLLPMFTFYICFNVNCSSYLLILSCVTFLHVY